MDNPLPLKLQGIIEVAYMRPFGGGGGARWGVQRSSSSSNTSGWLVLMALQAQTDLLEGRCLPYGVLYAGQEREQQEEDCSEKESISLCINCFPTVPITAGGAEERSTTAANQQPRCTVIVGSLSIAAPMWCP